MKILLATSLLLFTVAHAEVTSFPVIPSVTDPEITRLNDPHWIYLNREIVVDQREDLIPRRNQILVWLTGSGGKGHDAQGFSNRAAELGYHVITLMFPNDNPASACANDSDPKAFEASPAT